MEQAQQVGWQKTLGKWGRQTVAFAMSQHATDLGTPPNEPAGVEATTTTQQLWMAARENARGLSDPATFQAEFVRRVFAWCYDRLNGSVAA